jgi:phosphoribosyl-AMP cyclohydrolase
MQTPPELRRGFLLYAGRCERALGRCKAVQEVQDVMDFSKLDGLIPAVVQDHVSGEVLMVGFMNQEAWDVTRQTGYVTFYSRTRNALWTKGETSGNRLAVRDVLIDCDDDTVLVKAERLGDGNVCHTGERSCFFRRAEGVTLP